MEASNYTADTAETTTTEAAADTGPVIIAAQNPTAEEMKAICDDIKVNYNFQVDVKSTKFNFKTQKDKDTGVETKRESLELALPFPSVEGIVAILQAGGKQLELLQDAIEAVIVAQARDIISDDHKITAANFPVDKVSWEFIANLPKAQRRGGGIPKEIWEAFAKDYIEVMPEAANKSLEQVTNMSKILLNKLAQVKTNEAVLEMVVAQLAIYMENTKSPEEYTDCVAFLLDKADAFLNLSPEELLANL